MRRLAYINQVLCLHIVLFLRGVSCFRQVRRDINNPILRANPIPHHPAVSRTFEAIGGEQAFFDEFEILLSEASSMRNGIHAFAVEWRTFNFITAKICFDDGVCWAAKIRPIPENEGMILYEIMTRRLIEDYCPGIPIDNLIGCRYHKLAYCFTEWIESKTLSEVVWWSRSHDNSEIIFGLPTGVITSLAQFKYNLTTCPIPRHKSTSPSQSSNAYSGYSTT